MPNSDAGSIPEQFTLPQNILNSPTGGLHIHAFPHGEENWRIDWFGEVDYPYPYTRNRQPSVAVYLSKVVKASRTDRFTRFGHSDFAQTIEQRRVMVSIGTLTILRIGDIWRDGRLTERAECDWYEFKDVLIKRETTSFIKAGLSLPEGGFLLPLSEYQGHHECTQSYCLMVNLPEDKRLIIPCMELIRFYFGSSSKLLTSLFTPPLSLDSLFLEAKFHRDSKHLWILLAEKMSAISASDIGRLYLSDVAIRSAKHVGASIMKAPVHAEHIYPQSFFPFEGKSTLKTMGQWLSFAGIPNRTFLVSRLISCSHPFPFNSLRYEIEGQDLTATYSSAASNKRHDGGGNDDIPVVEQDASRHMRSTNRMAWNEPRFPDLTEKKIWKSKEITQINPISRGSAESITGMAFGDPGSTQPIRPFEVISSSFMDKYSKFEVPNFLQDIVLQMEALHTTFPKVRIELLTESESNGWTVSLQHLNDSCEDWHFLHDSDGKIIESQVCVLLFTCDLNQICFVLVDGDPRFIKLYSTTGLDKVEVWKLLERVPGDICTWLGDCNKVDDLTENCMIELDAWCSNQ